MKVSRGVVVAGGALVLLALAGGPARPAVLPAEPPELRAMQAVGVDSPTDAWAVGDHWRGSLGDRIKHWDGTRWRQVRDAAPGLSDPRAVVATSPTDAWIVGDSSGDTTLAEHWDGTAWHLLETQDPGTGGPENILWGVGEVTPTDVWAVGSTINGEASGNLVDGATLIEHWDGSAWSLVSSPVPPGLERPYLASVSVVSANDIWAVGGSRYTFRSVPLVEHWDGTAWSIVKAPNPGGINSLYGVSAVSASNVWAVGSAGSDHDHTLVEHWNGKKWSLVPSPDGDDGGGQNLLQSVNAVSKNDVWAVGHSGYDDGTGVGLVEHWDGSAWSIVASANPGAAGNGLTSVNAESGSDAWAVGYTVGAGGASAPLFEHWDGKTWSAVGH